MLVRSVAADGEHGEHMCMPGQLAFTRGRLPFMCSTPRLCNGAGPRLARRFKDPRIRALLSFQDLYVSPVDRRSLYNNHSHLCSRLLAVCDCVA